jgi:energy-coupling factor transport system ATP-binding protein
VNDPILLTRHLSHVYKNASLTKMALCDISLEVERGSCVAIIGITGSGKSTLVQHFNGLLKPSSGEVRVDGLVVGARGVDMRRLRRHVGLLFQFPETQLFASTIFADVAFGPQRMGFTHREVRTRVSAALEIVGLPFHLYARRSPFELSGGQQRRVALAGVLAMSPAVLILDEPTVGLDADARAEFYLYLRRIKQEQGGTIILVSHDMTEVASLADRLFVLHQGSLVMQGTPQQVYSQIEELRAWGLAAPPLSELLALLRKQGIPVPPEVFTLGEAYDWLHAYSHLSLQSPPNGL